MTAVVTAACSTHSVEVEENMYCGILSIGGSTVSEVSDGSTNNVVEGLQIPLTGEFAVTLTGDNGNSMRWSTVTEFNAESPYLAKGGYTIELSYGDTEAEGYGMPCFKGSAQAVVQPRKTTEATVKAFIANSLVAIECTDRFSSYFPEAEFCITTAAGGCFTTELPMQGPLFVSPDGNVEVVCTARKQTGEEVVFPAQEITPAPRTRYTLRYDVAQAGGTTLQITLNNELEEEIDIEAELNEYV